MHTVDFVIEGDETIHCQACERRIRNALLRLAGVADVRASAQSHRVAVTIDPTRVGPDEVRVRLKRLGYEARPAEEEL